MRTHCKRGHPFTPDNTYVYSDGRRECWTCKKALRRAYYEHMMSTPEGRWKKRSGQIADRLRRKRREIDQRS